MKRRIKVGGEDAGEIRVKPITLIYDGTYGTQKIEIEDEFPPLDCRILANHYHEVTQAVIDGWNAQALFVYCWYIMWTGNVADKNLAMCLPESKKEFDDAADNVKYIYSFLSAFLFRIIQAKGKPFRVQYPEIGLHPAIQANLGDLFAFCKDQSAMMSIAKVGGKGKQLIKYFQANAWCNDNLSSH